MRKQKVLMLADNPLSTSGVGCQARHLIDGLVKKGNWSFRVFGGAIRHENYDLHTVNEDFVVKPVDGFGNPDMLRQTLIQEKPDALFLFTDPRFFIWVWEMEEEIHQICPIVYWHVWDNDPFPRFNSVLYESTDLINCHAYKTYDVIHPHFPEKTNYIPHAVPEQLFYPLPEDKVLAHKTKLIGEERADHFTCIWVNRNARRKMPGNVLLAWKMFLDQLEEKHGHKKATLLMHTAPHDNEGQNLPVIADHFGISENIVYSANRIGFEEMNILYNISDFCINIACFPAGQEIMTRNGMQEIQNIEIGTEVLTHMGRFRPVKNVWKNPLQDRSIYTLKSTNNNPVRVTGNHKVYAIRRRDLPVDFYFNKNLDCALDFVKQAPVEELAVGDYVVYFNEQENVRSKNHTLDMMSFVNHKQSYDVIGENIVYGSQHGTGQVACRRFIDLDEDLAYIIGNWNADGSSGSTSIIFNGKDTENARRLEEKYDRVFGGHLTRRRNDNAQCLDVKVAGHANGVVLRMFSQLCGHGSAKKRIPEQIFNSPESVQRAYLDGHFAGDGCALKRHDGSFTRKRIRSISDSLARGLKRLLIGLGYVVKATRDVNGGWSKTPIWTIEWYEGKQHTVANRMWNVNRKALISRIYSLEVDADYTDKLVYNLEVEEDHTYNVGGFTVSNCHEGHGMSTHEAMRCGKPIIALKTGGLTRQVVDHRDGSENGIALEPDVRDLVGGQLVPYIYEDHVSPDKVADALMKMHELGPEGRAKLGQKAREYVKFEFDFQTTVDKWDTTMLNTIKQWKEDKASMYTPWEVKTL